MLVKMPKMTKTKRQTYVNPRACYIVAANTPKSSIHILQPNKKHKTTQRGHTTQLGTGQKDPWAFSPWRCSCRCCMCSRSSRRPWCRPPAPRRLRFAPRRAALSGRSRGAARGTVDGVLSKPWLKPLVGVYHRFSSFIPGFSDGGAGMVANNITHQATNRFRHA